jgi:hypothetical protein
MNIFMLDRSPTLAANYHCDKHVVKMILEYAQLLSTAHRELDDIDDDDVLYRKTHVNHPSGIWVRESSSNYGWLYNLFVSCCAEYTRRYGKVHLTQTKLLSRLSHLPDNIPDGDLTPMRLAMPDECKLDDPVAAYRGYYKSHKADIAVWNYSKTPYWW